MIWDLWEQWGPLVIQEWMVLPVLKVPKDRQERQVPPVLLV